LDSARPSHDQIAILAEKLREIFGRCRRQIDASF